MDWLSWCAVIVFILAIIYVIAMEYDIRVNYREDD